MIFCMICGTVFITGYAVWSFVLNDNFHSVIPRELYRSAQMTPQEIARYTARYHIRTIINLRGENTGRKWYDDEITASRQLHINHLDFRMSSRHELTREQELHLIALMRDAPKPLLIHCESGANRTSLAAALYVAAVEKGGEFAAETQLSLLYGHLPFHLNQAAAMTDSFEKMEPLFGYNS
jgi:protein tyrosine/serine phosphatase